MRNEREVASKPAISGAAGWVLKKLFARLCGSSRLQPRLALVERITLAPRQSLSLIEAEGRHILVATSADGSSAFYALDERPGRRAIPPLQRTNQHTSNAASRISW